MKLILFQKKEQQDIWVINRFHYSQNIIFFSLNHDFILESFEFPFSNTASVFGSNINFLLQNK